MKTKEISGLQFVFVNEALMDDPSYSGNFSEGDKPLNDWMLITCDTGDVVYLQSRTGTYEGIVNGFTDAFSASEDDQYDMQQIIEYYALALLHWPKN